MMWTAVAVEQCGQRLLSGVDSGCGAVWIAAAVWAAAAKRVDSSSVDSSSGVDSRGGGAVWTAAERVDRGCGAVAERCGQRRRRSGSGRAGPLSPGGLSARRSVASQESWRRAAGQCGARCEPCER